MKRRPIIHHGRMIYDAKALCGATGVNLIMTLARGAVTCKRCRRMDRRTRRADERAKLRSDLGEKTAC